MPISDKIINEIKNSTEWTREFKELLIELLNAEENHHNYKKVFEKIIEEYMEKLEENHHD